MPVDNFQDQRLARKFDPGTLGSTMRVSFVRVASVRSDERG